MLRYMFIAEIYVRHVLTKIVVSMNLISRKHHATMIFNDLEFLSPKYTLISLLSIGNLYFSFILLFITFYSLLIKPT